MSPPNSNLIGGQQQQQQQQQQNLLQPSTNHPSSSHVRPPQHPAAQSQFFPLIVIPSATPCHCAQQYFNNNQTSNSQQITYYVQSGTHFNPHLAYSQQQMEHHQMLGPMEGGSYFHPQLIYQPPPMTYYHPTAQIAPNYLASAQFNNNKYTFPSASYYYATTTTTDPRSQQMTTYYPAPISTATYSTTDYGGCMVDNTFAHYHRPQPILYHDSNQQLQQQYQRYQQLQQQPYQRNGSYKAVLPSPPMIAFSQMRLDYDLISMLPIDACPTRTRQAYGMDKVWRDEFESLFSQLQATSIVWTLIEVESNPSIRESSDIIGYKGRYLVRVSNYHEDEITISSSQLSEKENSIQGDKETCDDEEEEEEEESCCTTNAANDDTEEEEEEDDKSSNKSDQSIIGEQSTGEMMGEIIEKTDTLANGGELESDCDSGAQLDLTSGSSSSTGAISELDELKTGTLKQENSLIKEGSIEGKDINVLEKPQQAIVRKFPTRFRMFIDSAKVRFCCDHCGHGWTSMKGRVVFWYELFELIDHHHHHSQVEGDNWMGNGGISENNLIGYCAYKLFGQQCDVCKIENRFERPMWYPEEVSKVLNNLYNKIGQIYFGFEMPTIDKQRRAGKPKTSHNSSLCQACHDGVCTDRK